ncbi:MAG TPA: flagellar protein [Feifaniaceae bacterium]|nr:flagellar protein [Feifaniaceae bacterium]
MKVKQCRMCGKLFQSVGGSMCMECEDRLDQEFRLVRDYLYEHPEADIMELSKETGVSERSILQFLKDERLTLSVPSESIRCEHCGKAIASGKICAACKDRLSRILENMTEAAAAKQAEKRAPVEIMSYQDRRHLDDNKR